MSERVLLVEDEALVRDLVALNLKAAGYAVVVAATWQEGLSALMDGGVDLMIVDVMLPDGDGMDLLRRARAAGFSAPVMVLTARGETTAKVRGFDTGADDYVTKPFNVIELMARVRALLRRAGVATAASPRHVFGQGQYWIHLDSGLAMTSEGECVVSDKELRLLRLLISNEGRVLSRADMLEAAWGMDAFPTDRTVDNFILRLRRLFELDPEQPERILTARGRGYMYRRGP